jgi:hypothetical protein
LICINLAAFGSREHVRVAAFVDLEEVMAAPELAVLIGIIAAFTTFAVVLAWVSLGAMENLPQRRGPSQPGLQHETGMRLPNKGCASGGRRSAPLLFTPYADVARPIWSTRTVPPLAGSLDMPRKITSWIRISGNKS